MTTRVQRRRPRVPPRKGRQPLPQFEAGFAWADDMKLRALNSFLKLLGEKQIGGRLTPRQMKTLMRATDPRRLGIFPKTGQRGEGIFSRLASRLSGRQATKAAGKVAKAVPKRAAKKLTAKMTKAAAKQVASNASPPAMPDAISTASSIISVRGFPIPTPIPSSSSKDPTIHPSNLHSVIFSAISPMNSTQATTSLNSVPEALKTTAT